MIDTESSRYCGKNFPSSPEPKTNKVREFTSQILKKIALQHTNRNLFQIEKSDVEKSFETD